MALQNVMNHSDIHLLSDPSETCGICINNFVAPEEYIRCSDCSTPFHVGCIEPWLRDHTSCPVCRADATIVGKRIFIAGSADGNRRFRRLGMAIAPAAPAAPNELLDFLKLLLSVVALLIVERFTRVGVLRNAFAPRGGMMKINNKRNKTVKNKTITTGLSDSNMILANKIANSLLPLVKNDIPRDITLAELSMKTTDELLDLLYQMGISKKDVADILSMIKSSKLKP